MGGLIKSQNFSESTTPLETINNLIEQNRYELNEKYLTEDLKQFLNFQIDNFKKLRHFILSDMRYDHLILQKAMDDTFKKDTSITAINMILYFPNFKIGDNRMGYVTAQLTKNFTP